MSRFNRDIMFSSKTDLHETPQDFFDKLNEEFKFNLDVCATRENAKCTKYYTIEDNGLDQPWSGSIFMNPPYGRDIIKWMEKASKAAANGALVVCLVPARTDTKWWHTYALPHEVRFIKGRLKFGGAKNNAPFPSAVVIMRGWIMSRFDDIMDGLYDSKPIKTTWDWVKEDIARREQMGYHKYGKYLTPATDENMLQHLYEELLDSVVYIKTEILKRRCL